jgi:hypothetical protein
MASGRIAIALWLLLPHDLSENRYTLLRIMRQQPIPKLRRNKQIW